MADRYWVGGTAAWDGTAGTKWALTSGGAGGQAVPTTADDVFFNAASGVSTVTISAGNTGAKSINCTGFTGTIAGTAAITVAGSITKVAAMTWSHTGKVTITGSGTLINAGKSFGGGLDINGTGITVQLGDAYPGGTMELISGTFTTNNYNVSCAEFRVSGVATKVINAGSSTITVTSSGGAIGFGSTLNTSLTFNAGTSQINITLTGGTTTLQGGGQTFNNVAITHTAFNGNITINAPNIFNNLSITAPAGTGITFVNVNNNQTVNGTFTCAGSNKGGREFLRSGTLGTSRTITAAIVSANDCDFRDITIAGAASPISPTRPGDCGGNSGITFPAAKTLYWNLAGAANLLASDGWALLSGGAPSSANFPLAQDTMVFNNSGTVSGTITVSPQFNIGTLDMTNRTTSMTLAFTASPQVYGDFKLSSAAAVSVTYAGSQDMTFAGRGNLQTIQCNGKSINLPIVIDKFSGTVQLADDFTSNYNSTTGGITIRSGDFDAVSYNVTSPRFICSFPGSNLGYYANVYMGSGTWSMTGSGTGVSTSPWVVTKTTYPNQVGFYSNTSTIVLANTISTSTQNFNSDNVTYNKIVLGGIPTTNNEYQFTCTTSSMIINELTSTKKKGYLITFANNQEVTINTWSISGRSDGVVLVRSNSAGFNRQVAIKNKTINVDYLNIKDIFVNLDSSNTYIFYAGANSTNVINNQNIAFIDRSTNNLQVAQLLGSSNTSWTTPDTWNNSNNKIYMMAGGGGGANNSVTGDSRAAGGGGGGGGFGLITNFNSSPGTVISCSIASTSATPNINGGNTSWASTYTAIGGKRGNAAGVAQSSTGGAGGGFTTSPTISLVDKVNLQDTVSRQTFTINKPSLTQIGNLLIVFLQADTSTPTWTAPIGWTIVNGPYGDAVAYKYADSNDGSSFIFTSSGNSTSQGTIVAYSNAAIDIIGTAGSNSSTPTAASITLDFDNSYVLAFFRSTSMAASATFSTPSGFSVVDQTTDSNVPTMAIFGKSFNKGATGTVSSTTSDGLSARAYLIGLNSTFVGFTGGTGGAGAFGTTIGNGYGGGGGGGAGGLFGNGGNGGIGFGPTTVGIAGGGGGGNGGGSNGGNASGATGGTGGNGWLGTGGAPAGGDATQNTGGGATGSTNSTPRRPAKGIDILNTIGGAGGWGGKTDGSLGPQSVASYSYGFGGGGAGVNTTGANQGGFAGGPGFIFIVYTEDESNFGYRIENTGNLFVPITAHFDEITQTKIGVTKTAFYAEEFDEVTNPGIPLRYLNTGVVQTQGIIDEITGIS